MRGDKNVDVAGGRAPVQIHALQAKEGCTLAPPPKELEERLALLTERSQQLSDRNRQLTQRKEELENQASAARGSRNL